MTHQSRIVVPVVKYLARRYGLICGCEHVMYITGADGKKSARVHILIGDADHVLANIDLPDEPEVERASPLDALHADIIKAKRTLDAARRDGCCEDIKKGSE